MHSCVTTQSPRAKPSCCMWLLHSCIIYSILPCLGCINYNQAMHIVDNSRSSSEYYYCLYWVHVLIGHYLTTGRKYALIKKYTFNNHVRLLTRLYGISSGQHGHNTVEPPITDSPRYRPPLYNGQTTCPIAFTIEITATFLTSKRRTTSYISGQRTENMYPKDKQLYKIASKSGQISKPRVEHVRSASCKISTDSYSAAPRKYTRSFLLSIFVHLVRPHKVTDSASYRPHPSLQLCN